jgi:hypothetical protein
MIAAGIITAIVGIVIMMVAGNKRKEAESVEQFTTALGGLPGSPAGDAAVTWGSHRVGCVDCCCWR